MRWTAADGEQEVGTARDRLRRNGETSVSREDEATPLPVSGRLVWMTPQGTLREIDPAVLSGDESPARCPDCENATCLPTRAREHPDCGYVALDGFVMPERGAVCPKCGTEDHEDGHFPVVAVVQSCLSCGRVLDRP